MTSDVISPGDYANHMVEVVENLIVKVGRQLPPDRQIPGEVITDWKRYTVRYFQYSPNAFLTENEFYNMLSSNMKVKVVKDNLLQPFQERFDILFFDPEFGFKADDKLITQVVASLSYEFCDVNESRHQKSIIMNDVVSSGIYFIYEGQVDMYYKDSNHPLIMFDRGSYFGDISYIFQVRNQYFYYFRPTSADA